MPVIFRAPPVPAVLLVSRLRMPPLRPIAHFSVEIDVTAVGGNRTVFRNLRDRFSGWCDIAKIGTYGIALDIGGAGIFATAAISGRQIFWHFIPKSIYFIFINGIPLCIFLRRIKFNSTAAARSKISAIGRDIRIDDDRTDTISVRIGIQLHIQFTAVFVSSNFLIDGDIPLGFQGQCRFSIPFHLRFDGRIHGDAGSLTGRRRLDRHIRAPIQDIRNQIRLDPGSGIVSRIGILGGRRWVIIGNLRSAAFIDRANGLIHTAPA